MSKFAPSKFWGDSIDLSNLCRNWTQDQNGTQRRMVNSAAVLSLLARKTNFLAARHMRPIFQRLHSESDLLSTTAASQVLHSTRFSDYYDNEIDYVIRVLALNRENGTGDAVVQFAGTSSGLYNTTIAASSFPEDLFLVQFEHNRGAPSDGFVDLDLEVDNGFLIVDCVVQGKQIDVIDTDTHLHASPYFAQAGGPILADSNAQIANANHKMRTENLHILGEWHANKVALGWATPAAPGDAMGMTVTSDTYVNALDQSVTYPGRTATTPGIYCPAKYCGKGQSGSIEIAFSVLATATTYDGKVAIEGPDHVSNPATEVTITAGAGPAWFDSSGTIYLNTAAGYALATTERNKVDVWLKTMTAGGTMTVYTIVIYAV